MILKFLVWFLVFLTFVMENSCKSSLSKSSVSSDVIIDSSDENKFLILIINIVLWIFFPVTAIALFLYLIINIVIDSFSITSFLLSTYSNVPKCCESNAVDESAEFNAHVNCIKLLLDGARQRLLDFKIYYLDKKLDEVVLHMIKDVCERFNNIIGKLESYCNAESLKAIKEELSYIINDIVDDMKLDYGPYSTVNLLVGCLLTHISFSFDEKVIPILRRCEEIINNMLAKKLTISSVDGISVSGTMSVGRNC